MRSVLGPTKPDRLRSRGGAPYINASWILPKTPKRLDSSAFGSLTRSTTNKTNVCGSFVAAAHACIGHAEPLVNTSLINNLAFTLMEAGNHATAESEFRRALAIDPHFENAAVNLGLLLARQRRYDESLAILAPAIGAAAAHHNVGVIAIDLGDQPVAYQQFTLAGSQPGAPQATQDFLAALTKSTI